MIIRYDHVRKEVVLYRENADRADRIECSILLTKCLVNKMLNEK
jgi:hypothetical protein